MATQDQIMDAMLDIMPVASFKDVVLESGFINSSGGESASATWRRTTDFIAIEPGAGYTQKDPLTKNWGSFYDADQNWIPPRLLTRGTPYTNYTAPANAHFVRLNFHRNVVNAGTQAFYRRPTIDELVAVLGGTISQAEFDAAYTAALAAFGEMVTVSVIGDDYHWRRCRGGKCYYKDDPRHESVVPRSSVRADPHLVITPA